MTHEAGSSWYHLWVLYNLFQTELFPVIFQVKFLSWFVSPRLIFLRAEFFPCWFFALLTFFLFDFLLVKLFLVESFFLKYFFVVEFFLVKFFSGWMREKGFSSNLFQNPIPADTSSFLQKIYRSQNSYHIIIIFLCFCFCQPFGLDITWVKKRVCTLIIFIEARTCYPGRSFILTKDSSSAKLISYFHHDVLLLFSLFVNKLDNWSVIQIYRN